jgi:Icc-related predicted phosphoesterase
VSDLHYSLKQFDWLVTHGVGYELVVVAGDCLDVSSDLPLEAQAVVVLEYLSLLHRSTKVAVSSGNHDLVGPDEHGEQCALWLREAKAAGIPGDGDSIVDEGILVTICPWWDGPEGRAALDGQLKLDAQRRPRTWIWVYHWPPAGTSTCWTGKREYGDADLSAWIVEHQPDAVLTGHVHQSPFVADGSWACVVGDTWVFNAGNQKGPLPTRIEIDLDQQVATWTSLMGVERVDISGRTAPARGF